MQASSLSEQQRQQQAAHLVMEPISEEAATSRPSGKSVDLSLQIPPRPVNFGSSRSGTILLQSQGSLKSSSTSRSFLESLSFKHSSAVLDSEESSLLKKDLKPISGSPDLTNFVSSLSWKRCVSLPVTPASNLSPSVPTPSSESICGQSHDSQQRAVVPSKVMRSLSVPVHKVVIVRSGSFPIPKDSIQIDLLDDQINPSQLEIGDEEIPEEEAVCRICLIALAEGGTTLQMECSCKGDLRLTHEECAVKWFRIKGNKICDVCGNEVLNLPVIVLRVQSSNHRIHSQEQNRRSSNSQSISAWHDLVLLVLISSISYFFILEQLLIQDMKSDAIVIAAPCAFTLGLVGSIFAVIIAIKQYVWTYAAFEFSLVAMILHLIYSVLNFNAVYAILLAAILGFGIAMGINSLYIYQLGRIRHREAEINSNQV